MDSLDQAFGIRTIVGITGVALAILVTGCGGGGGGGSSTTEPPPEGPINVSRITRPSPGNSLAAELSGTISSEGETLEATATVNRAVGEETTFDGQNAIPVTQIVTIRVPSTGGVVNGSGTSYFREDGAVIGTDSDNGVTCFADSSNPTPQEVEIGDSGPIASLTCSDGSTIQLSFRVEAGDGTLDLVVVSQVFTDSSMLSELVTYRFASDNDVVSLRDEGTIRDNGRTITFDLLGNVVTTNP